MMCTVLNVDQYMGSVWHGSTNGSRSCFARSRAKGVKKNGSWREAPVFCALWSGMGRTEPKNVAPPAPSACWPAAYQNASQLRGINNEIATAHLEKFTVSRLAREES
jgi:hypothetical protein